MIEEVDGDVILVPGDVLFLRGSPAGITRLHELAAAPTWEQPPVAGGALSDLDRAVDVLVEMKNISEAAVGLAYSALSLARRRPGRGGAPPGRAPRRDEGPPPALGVAGGQARHRPLAPAGAVAAGLGLRGAGRPGQPHGVAHRRRLRAAPHREAGPRRGRRGGGQGAGGRRLGGRRQAPRRPAPRHRARLQRARHPPRQPLPLPAPGLRPAAAGRRAHRHRPPRGPQPPRRAVRLVVGGRRGRPHRRDRAAAPALAGRLEHRAVSWSAMSDPLRLLTVHAHPDDESSKGSSTVAKYAAEGIGSTLVCCTGGEAGEVLNPAMDRPEVHANLAEVRRASWPRPPPPSATTASTCSATTTPACPTPRSTTGRTTSGTPISTRPWDGSSPSSAATGRRWSSTYGDDQRHYAHPDHLKVHDISLPAFDRAADPGLVPGGRGAVAAAQALLHGVVAPADAGAAREVPRARPGVAVR